MATAATLKCFHTAVKMRGIELEVSKHLIGDKETDFTQYDIIYLGGGADFEQQILADDLVSCKDSIMEAYKAGTFFSDDMRRLSAHGSVL